MAKSTGTHRRWAAQYQERQEWVCAKCHGDATYLVPAEDATQPRVYLCMTCRQRYRKYMQDYEYRLATWEDAVCYTSKYRQKLYAVSVFLMPRKKKRKDEGGKIDE